MLYYTKVIVDRLTGIQYVYHRQNNGGGMTVLLGPDGKPLLYTPEQWQ